MTTLRARVWGGGVLFCCLSAAGSAQDRPADFKTLYAAAAYEEALVLLSPLDTIEAYQYRALCLLALGQPEGASAAVSSLVTASPTFLPSAEEAPPRFVELVAETRRRLLPAIARRTFAEGREQFAAKQAEKAVERFTLVLTLVSDPDFRDQATAQDLTTLARGFIDLAQTTVASPRLAQAVDPPVDAAPAARPVLPRVTQPVAIEQRVPGVPPEVLGRAGPVLSLHVQIDREGKVTAATVQQSAHPIYDRLVLQAARQWRYTPATLNGRPIPSDQVVTIQIAAR